MWRLNNHVCTIWNNKMKLNLIRPLFFITIVLLLTGCFFCTYKVNTAEVKLDQNQKVCINIPKEKVRSTDVFNISSSSIFVTRIGYIWEQEDHGSIYQAKAGECLRFDYPFQVDVDYSIDFVSTNLKNNEDKPWIASFRLKKKADGNLKILWPNDPDETKTE